jgi:ribosomal protein L7/L12
VTPLGPKTVLLLLALLLSSLATFAVATGSGGAAGYLVAAVVALVLANLAGLLGYRGRRGTANPEALDEVRALSAAGQKIAAIRRYREVTGQGLADAKRYVDELPTADERARHPLPLPPDLEEDVRTIVTFGGKVEAIKRVRELSGAGLKEAKAYVERLSGAGPQGESEGQ